LNAAVQDELQSKFTTSERSYIWSWLCDANINAALIIIFVKSEKS